MDDKEKDKADKAMDQLPPLVIVLSQGKETTDNIINSKTKKNQIFLNPHADRFNQFFLCFFLYYRHTKNSAYRQYTTIG